MLVMYSIIAFSVGIVRVINNFVLQLIIQNYILYLAALRHNFFSKILPPKWGASDALTQRF